MSQPIKYWTARNGGITANKADAVNDTSDNSALVAHSDYAALAAENERLRKATEWQPIETAPFDPNVLIMVFTFSKQIEIMYSTDLQWFDDANYFPTHWMPLPAAPAAKEGGSK